MKPLPVAALHREGRLEGVEPDLVAARSKVADARKHLESAAAVANGDPEGAYALLYDAARKAIDAHMLANGYRVSKTRLGSHEATGLYALAALGRGEGREHVRQFDRMRRTRNRSEYGSWAIGEATLRADLAHAQAIVGAVEADLLGRASPSP